MHTEDAHALLKSTTVLDTVHGGLGLYDNSTAAATDYIFRGASDEERGDGVFVTSCSIVTMHSCHILNKACVGVMMYPSATASISNCTVENDRYACIGGSGESLCR